MNKGAPKAKDSANKEVSDYQHVRNVVNAKMKVSKNRMTSSSFRSMKNVRRKAELLKLSTKNEQNNRTAY